MPSQNNESKKDAAGTMNRLLECMQDVANDIPGIIRKGSMRMSPGLQAALDKAFRAGASGISRTAEKFQRSLEKIVEEAKKAGLTDVLNWAEGRANQFTKYVLDAKEDGMLPDESLELQIRSASRGGRDGLSEALERFNRRQAKKSADATRSAGESEEHRKLREAAEKLQDLKKDMEVVDRTTDPDLWKDLSEEIEKQSMKVSEFASLYMKLKNREDLTGAAKERYNGAMDLWSESEMIRVDYRKLLESDSFTKDPVTGEYRETSFNDMVKEHEGPGKESVREPRVRRRAPAPEDELTPEELRREKSLEAPTLTNGPGY